MLKRVTILNLKGATSQLNGLESLTQNFSILSFLTILVPLSFIIFSLVFFYLCKALFSDFLQFKDNVVDAQNTNGSAPLSAATMVLGDVLATALCDKILFLSVLEGNRIGCVIFLSISTTFVAHGS